MSIKWYKRKQINDVNTITFRKSVRKNGRYKATRLKIIFDKDIPINNRVEFGYDEDKQCLYLREGESGYKITEVGYKKHTTVTNKNLVSIIEKFDGDHGLYLSKDMNGVYVVYLEK